MVVPFCCYGQTETQQAWVHVGAHLAYLFWTVLLTYTEARYKIIRDIITECSEILTYPNFLNDIVLTIVI